MLNYVVCDDDKNFTLQVSKQIEKFMMAIDMPYEIHTFSSYDNKFEEFAKKELGFKAYFLDIKTDYGQGMDAVRYIREELDDWDSIIVMVTSFAEYRYEALTSRLAILDFVNKLNRCKKTIDEDLEIILKTYSSNPKALKYSYNYNAYRIEFSSIVYIEKEKDSKRSIIHTSYGEYTIPKTLNELSKDLDEKFYRISRTTIINLDKVRSFDTKNNTLRMANDVIIDKISRDKKKLLANKIKTS